MTKRTTQAWLMSSMAIACSSATCIPMKTLSVPLINPATGRAPSQELRRPHNDRRLKKDCIAQGFSDCVDTFWRLERVSAKSVVFRYRRVSWDKKSTRANVKWLAKIRLVTPGGRLASARLSEQFSMYRLPTISYKDRGYVKTGRRVHQRQSDGRITSQDETTIGTVTKRLPRYVGVNYVVFEGQNLITAETKFVRFRFPKGLLGGGAEWTFRFDNATPINAQVATPEPAQ